MATISGDSLVDAKIVHVVVSSRANAVRSLEFNHSFQLTSSALFGIQRPAIRNLRKRIREHCNLRGFLHIVSRVIELKRMPPSRSVKFTDLRNIIVGQEPGEIVKPIQCLRETYVIFCCKRVHVQRASLFEIWWVSVDEAIGAA